MTAAETDTGPRPGPTLRVEAPSRSPDEKFLAQLGVAIEHEAAGRLDEAEALLRQMLAPSADRPRAQHLLALVLFRKGRVQEALARLERAIALMPNEALFHRNICE